VVSVSGRRTDGLHVEMCIICIVMQNLSENWAGTTKVVVNSWEGLPGEKSLEVSSKNRHIPY